MKKILILLVIVLILSGCYDYRELNDMSIVTGIGIDYIDNEYIVSLEVTKSIKDGSSNKIESVIYTGRNQVIADAFLEAKNRSDKFVYMEHVNILLLGRKLCEKGIGEVLDYVIRDTSINSNYYMAMVDNPDKIFNTKQENDSMSNVITNTINYYFGDTSFDDLDIMSSYMINDKDDIALPIVSLDENKVLFDCIAYFNGDKFVGEIDSKLYTLLRLNSNNINFSKNGNTISIYKNKVKYDVSKDTIVISLSGEGLVKKVNSKIDLKHKNDYKYLSKIISKDVKEEIELFLSETLNKESDLLGLQDKYYKKYKKKMNNLKYKIEVNIKINKNGTIYGVLYD